MADVTTAYRNAITNYLRGNGAPTAISDVFLDCYNGDPQGAGSSVLATITGSATRASVKAALGASSGGVSTNASPITVTASASGGATITHLALFDAATAGNLICSHALTSGNQVVTATNPVTVPASGLTITTS
jgi:hypothetical protein